MRTLPPALPALAAGLLCATSAAAQTFSGAGPARVFAMPSLGETPAARPEATRAAPRGLRRPPSIPAPLRLSGESAAITWPFYVTEAEARAGGRFVVGYLSAVSVLPEASTMTLAVNGAKAGTAAIDGARGLREAGFAIAPGKLAHGWNALHLSVAQRHRVDCSLAATYELWTQIDAEGTGFLPAAPAAIAEPADLAALSPAADGAVPIRLVQAGRMPEAAIERLIGALQDATLAGRFSQPAAEFGPTAQGDGLNIAVGTAETLAAALDATTLGTVAGPRLALLPGTDGRRPTLLATGRSEAEVDDALRAFSRLRSAAPSGTPEGLRALADANGRRVAGGERVSLADLGFADAHVTGRLHRIGFDLAMPHDFLPADYAKVVLDLVGSYGPGLAPGAKIIVEINGRNAASAELGRARGETMTRKSVFMPLSLMRPGLNRITLSALLPREDDRACANGEAQDGEAQAAERLFLSAATAITVPPLARIGRQPDLAQTVAAGFPYAQGRRPTLAVPAPDRETMEAAATLAARLALAAGAPLPFAFAAGKSASEKAPSGPAIVVAAAPALDPALLTAAGLDPAALRKAWTGREPAPPASAEIRPGAVRRRLLQRDGLAACRAQGPADAKQASDAPDLAQASAVIAQAVTGPAPEDVLTLVTAASGPALDEAVDCLVHPRVWPLARGRLALASADGSVRSVEADAPRFVATAPASLGNLRRIAAGWLSLHAGFYGLFALVLAGLLAVSTHRLVTNLGRRSS